MSLLWLLGHASRFINRLAGGHPSQSLCARIAVARGERCRFCRFIGWVLRDPDHCLTELRFWLYG